MWCWWKMVSQESTNSSTIGLSRVLRSCTTLAKDSPCVRTPLTDTTTDPTQGRRATLPAALIPVDLAESSVSVAVPAKTGQEEGGKKGELRAFGSLRVQGGEFFSPGCRSAAPAAAKEEEQEEQRRCVLS